MLLLVVTAEIDDPLAERAANLPLAYHAGSAALDIDVRAALAKLAAAMGYDWTDLGDARVFASVEDTPIVAPRGIGHGRGAR